MLKVSAVVLLLVFVGSMRFANAQETVPALEAYGGYYYARFNANANVQGVPPSSTFNANGGGGQLEYNASKWLGIVGDLAGYGVTSTNNGALEAGTFTYLLGPRLNFRTRKITPFAQALFGGMAATSGIGTSATQNHFAMTTGGGIDFTVSRHVSLRPVQAEYFMTRFPDGLNNQQNNFRFGTGIVVRLAK
jgi:hypothetical protein